MRLRPREAAAARLAGATWAEIAERFGYANSRSARLSVLWVAESDEERQALQDAVPWPPPEPKPCSIDGCARPHFGRGWCRTHYERWRRHGTPADRPRRRRTLEEILWPRITIGQEDECWEWQASRNQKGYGTVMYKGGSRLAHRMVYQHVNGEIPQGMMVCHHCDNPPCCNPAHLFVGTAEDNAADRDAKGRHTPSPGSRNGFAKMDEERVAALRAFVAAGHTQVEAAVAFNIGQSTVSEIVRRKRWSHVP